VLNLPHHFHLLPQQCQVNLLALAGQLAERKVGKLAIEFFEQVDAWQYNQQLLHTGNYKIRVQGNLSVRWQDADSTAVSIDNWDRSESESDAETGIEYQVKKRSGYISLEVMLIHHN
jgi:hypothetical protein